MRHIIVPIIFTLLMLNAETLFEVKDASNRKVLDVSTDGLRVLNGNDTLMVISPAGVRVNLDNSAGKALSRTFAVTTTASKGRGNAFEVGVDSTKIGTGTTTMGLGINKYSDLSPDNICIGSYSGVSNSGLSNVFLGNFSGTYNTSGSRNVFIGEESGYSNINGSSNVFIGEESGLNNTDKNWNTAIGCWAGRDSDGSLNTFVGYGSGYDCTGDENSFFGTSSGAFVGSGFENSAFGMNAAMYNKKGESNCVFGYNSGTGINGSTEYDNNCLFGVNAGKVLETGSMNVIIGHTAGSSATTAQNNVFVGYRSASSITTGTNNVFIGTASGYLNSTGQGNVFIGTNAGYSEVGSNRFYLNNGLYSIPLLFGIFDPNKMIVVDGTSSNNLNGRKFFVNGSAGGTTAWYNDSDRRLKKNIEDISSPLQKVMKLRGVAYEWNDPEKYEKGKKIGFIAQEAIEIVPEVVDYNSENDAYSMQYAPVTALLVEALKEQNNEISNLRKENNEIKKQLDEIKKMLLNK
jgi:trimeric autotransporter adhesin